MTIFILASGLGAGNAGGRGDPGGAEGPGSPDNPADWPPPGPAFIVDIAPTALAHLGFAIDPAWRLDGRPLGERR